MRTFLIAYDLANPGRNRHALAAAIMSLGASWARPLDQTWFIKAACGEAEIEARLAGIVDENDGLIVQPVADTGALTNTSLRWFRQRAAAANDDAVAGKPGECNVIAFPLSTAA
jgi:hypothetical protein